MTFQTHGFDLTGAIVALILTAACGRTVKVDAAVRVARLPSDEGYRVDVKVGALPFEAVTDERFAALADAQAFARRWVRASRAARSLHPTVPPARPLARSAAERKRAVA